MNVTDHGQAAQQVLYRLQDGRGYRGQTGMVSSPHQDQPRDDDDDDHHPTAGIGQGLHGSVQVFAFRMFADQQIEFNLLDRAFQISPGQEIPPVRMKTGEEGQVKPPDGKEDEKRAEQDMDKTHITHEEFVYCFSCGDRKRIGDIETGHNQYEY